VRNENMARLYVRDAGESIASALGGTFFDAPVIGPPKEPNGEAIGFDWRGAGYYTISEDVEPNLYYFHRTSRAPGDPPLPTPSWHNAALPADVNGDGFVQPLDVLVIINDINANGARALPTPTAPVSAFLDVDGNNFVSPLDVLRVINELNSSTQSSFTAQNQVEPAAKVASQGPTDSQSVKAHDDVMSSVDWRQEIADERSNSIALPVVTSAHSGQLPFGPRLPSRGRRVTPAEAAGALA
jgi:hypothetical protein